MGREIRRVPANWEHPRRNCPHSPWNGGCDEAKQNDGKCYQPMFDHDFDGALAEWLEGYELWKQGKHPDQAKYFSDRPNTPYWEWEGAPPDPNYYHPVWDKADWFQVYETVSEGTPVTPPFATKEELIDYLVENGDFWDQYRGEGGWDRQVAERFVEKEHAMSLMAVIKPDGTGKIMEPRTGS